ASGAARSVQARQGGGQSADFGDAGRRLNREARMDADRLQQAIDLYDRFTHDGMDRREFFGRMTLIAGSAAAATSLIAAIAPSPAAAAILPEDDKRLRTRMAELPLPGIPTYRAYLAQPRGAGRYPSVVVIHENRGLNA